MWLLEMPCRYGVVYPNGDNVLAAAVTSRRIGRKLAALPCMVSSRGDEECVVTFHVDDAEMVLAVLRPCLAHVMTEARRRAIDAARTRSPLGFARGGNGVRVAAMPKRARDRRP